MKYFKIMDHLQKKWSDPKGLRGQVFMDASEMLKNYKELLDILLEGIGEVERILKAMI